MAEAPARPAPAGPASGASPRGWDLAAARQLLVRAMAELGAPRVPASLVKGKLVEIDPHFRHQDWGFGRFHQFLRHFPDVVEVAPAAGGDLAVSLVHPVPPGPYGHGRS